MLRAVLLPACEGSSPRAGGPIIRILSPGDPSSRSALCVRTCSFRRFAASGQQFHGNKRGGLPDPAKANTSINDLNVYRAKTTLPSPRSDAGAKRLSRTPDLKHGYPQQLLIYSAGTGRTVFLSSVKLTGVLIFLFSALFVAPAYYYSPLQPTWMAAAVLVGGAVPLTIMVFTTAPFVTYVHLQLPLWSRASSARLHRFAASLPSSAQLDITTLKWIWPRVTRLSARELFIHKSETIGAMTLRRSIPKVVNEQKQWYDWQPIKKFYVAGKSGSQVPEQGVWEGVVGSIARGWAKPGQPDRLLVKT